MAQLLRNIKEHLSMEDKLDDCWEDRLGRWEGRLDRLEHKLDCWKDDSSKVIYSKPLSELRNASPLDISPLATPRRFRFIHCGKFIHDQILAIHEFSEIPTNSISYSAISYVWKGLGPPYTDGKYGTFAVKGAEHGDPISIDVLRHACTAAKSHDILKRKHTDTGHFIDGVSRYIWLDRLCILQENHDEKARDDRTDDEKSRDEKARKDKDWQITKMHQIYSDCNICIVLPGGIRRLAGVEEDTDWIHRSWTFQEATAQVNAIVLFAWKHGKLDMKAEDLNFHYSELIRDQSAICTLNTALQCNSLGTFGMSQGGSGTFPIFTKRGELHISVNLLGRADDPRVTALLAVMEAIDEDDGVDYTEAIQQGIWRCSLMRTSSRPIDAVFSIMGMLKVELDPTPFHKNDRPGATIALAQALLQKGQRASWLAPFISLPPARGLSVFPEFPNVRAELREAMLGSYPVAELLPNAKEGWLDGIPSGLMDNDGFFTFSAHAVPLVPATSQPEFEAGDGSMWRIHRDRGGTYQPARAYLVYIGELKLYANWLSMGHHLGLSRWRALLVEQNGAVTYYRRSYFELDESQSDVARSTSCTTFRLGGDEPPQVPVQPIQPQSPVQPRVASSGVIRRLLCCCC